MADAQAVLDRQVVYDGEDYTRQGLETTVAGYTAKHQENLKTLAELSKAHDQLRQEMTADLVEQKTTWEHVGNILKLHQVGTNFRGLMEKVPGLRSLVPSRPLHTLLTEKVEVAQRRTREVGNYLDRIQVEIQSLQKDIETLNARMVQAARNEEAAAAYVLDLKAALEALEKQLSGLDKESARARELQSQGDAIKHKIWEHGAKLRLYSTAENRIAGVIRMNNNFLEILRNLHANMQSLYEAGNEVLSELEGNLAALASAAKASELSLQMQKSMESLRASVNKVATLASETSLFLTQNVDRMVQEMKVYDEGTEQLVEANLKAEREVQEQRINETILLAEQGMKSRQGARAG
jgi:hypothetical protein